MVRPDPAERLLGRTKGVGQLLGTAIVVENLARFGRHGTQEAVPGLLERSVEGGLIGGQSCNVVAEVKHRAYLRRAAPGPDDMEVNEGVGRDLAPGSYPDCHTSAVTPR
jgi:hypothetical protein